VFQSGLSQVFRVDVVAGDQARESEDAPTYSSHSRSADTTGAKLTSGRSESWANAATLLMPLIRSASSRRYSSFGGRQDEVTLADVA
jgi:hypothetical protein